MSNYDCVLLTYHAPYITVNILLLLVRARRLQVLFCFYSLFNALSCLSSSSLEVENNFPVLKFKNLCDFTSVHKSSSYHGQLIARS